MYRDMDTAKNLLIATKILLFDFEPFMDERVNFHEYQSFLMIYALEIRCFTVVPLFLDKHTWSCFPLDLPFPQGIISKLSHFC